MPPKFYRLLNAHPGPQPRDDKEKSPEKLTESIVRNNHFVYIDVNSERGLCEMESIDAEEADQDMEVFAGNNYLCGVNRLPLESQKVMDYVYKMQELRKQKQKFKQLLKDQINATVLKYAKPKSKKKVNRNISKTSEKKEVEIQSHSHVGSEALREFKHLPRKLRSLSLVTNPEQVVKAQQEGGSRGNVVIYRGMETRHLREYLEQRELEQINAQIIEKEKLLIAKYGFTRQFESSTKAKSPIIRQNGKVFLPEIKSMPHFAF